MHFLHQQSSDTNLATIMKAVVGQRNWQWKSFVVTQQQLISMTRRKRERWWTLSLQTVPKWSNVWLMMLTNFTGLKLAPPLFWETSIARSCHKCDSDISCTTNPQPPTIYGEGRDGHFASPPPPVDVKSVEEALASPTKTKVSVHGKIIQVCIQTGERKTPVVFFHNLTFSYYFLVMVQILCMNIQCCIHFLIITCIHPII